MPKVQDQDADLTSVFPPPLPTAIEYKKDGSVSRMRSHKGNVPQLPQTKLCPFCPAKFTRTTHLNRHLRNHTNERMYRCETCGAQFTRSDLLARHRKSCGETHPISRSRRRSCQACATLKVKCDLRHPCAKCTSRGRDCVYNTENGSPDSATRSASPARNGADPPAASSSRSPFPQGVTKLDASAGFDPWAFANPGGTFDAAFPELSLIEEANALMSQPPLTEANMAATFGTMQPPRANSPVSQVRTLPNPNYDVASSDAASSFVAQNNRPLSFFQSEMAAPSSMSNLAAYNSDMFEPFFRGIFQSPTGNAPTQTAPMPPIEEGSNIGSFLGPDSFISTNGAPQFEPTALENELMYDMMTNTYPSPPETQPPEPSPPEPQVTSKGPSNGLSPNGAYGDATPHQQLELPPELAAEPDQPTPVELQHYLYVFLTTFLPQMPIVHTPSLRVELKPPILLRAMQACGALFVKTKTAEAFVEKTLNTSREVLVSEFGKPSPDPKHQVHIIVTVILLQTIGLFHQDPQQRARSNIYHGMLVLMIRQSRVVERNTGWAHKAFPVSDPEELEQLWRDWASHETIKRALFLAYCHDLAHRIYFALPASFHSSEFTLHLPVDEDLWSATTPRAWSQALSAPSPYGTADERILGIPMPRALAAVGLEGMKINTAGSPSPPKDMVQIPPFGHFIIMHTILGELFRRCSGAPAPVSNVGGGAAEEVNENVFALQFALHRWLQLWLSSPDCPRPAPPRHTVNSALETRKTQDPPYMLDPLPFYWLAQLLLLAFQESFPPFTTQPPLPCPITSASASPITTASGSTGSAHSSPGHSGFASPDVMAPQYHPKPRAQADASAAQFMLIKRWQQQIRLFLRRNQGSPTVVWDELMKIRLRGWGAGAESSEQGSTGTPEDEGLLGFFEEKLKI